MPTSASDRVCSNWNHKHTGKLNVCFGIAAKSFVSGTQMLPPIILVGLEAGRRQSALSGFLA